MRHKQDDEVLYLSTTVRNELWQILIVILLLDLRCGLRCGFRSMSIFFEFFFGIFVRVLYGVSHV